MPAKVMQRWDYEWNEACQWVSKIVYTGRNELRMKESILVVLNWIG